MASVDDLVTVQKNGVVAVNALVQTLGDFQAVYSSFVGTSSRLGIDENQLVVSGPGRLVSISIITAAAGGTIHDVDQLVDASTSNTILLIPNSTGIMNVNFPFTDGLVIKPAATSVISIAYSVG